MNRQKHINTFQLDDDDVSESRQHIHLPLGYPVFMALMFSTHRKI